MLTTDMSTWLIDTCLLYFSLAFHVEHFYNKITLREALASCRKVLHNPQPATTAPHQHAHKGLSLHHLMPIAKARLIAAEGASP